MAWKGGIVPSPPPRLHQHSSSNPQITLSSGSTWMLGLIRATCQGLTRTCYPSVSNDRALSFSLSFSHQHTHTDRNSHTRFVRVCNRNQLGFQGHAVGQTGPFITLLWVLMKVGSGAAAVWREWGNDERAGRRFTPHSLYSPFKKCTVWGRILYFL